MKPTNSGYQNKFNLHLEPYCAKVVDNNSSDCSFERWQCEKWQRHILLHGWQTHREAHVNCTAYPISFICWMRWNSDEIIFIASTNAQRVRNLWKWEWQEGQQQQNQIFQNAQPTARTIRSFRPCWQGEEPNPCGKEGNLVTRLWYDTCKSMDNQRIIQSAPGIFSLKSLSTDVVTTVGKRRAPNADRRSGAPNVYWPHVWLLIQAVKRSVDCN
jgi:hypothetical protein